MKLRNKILAGVTAVLITTSGIALKINANTENTYYKYLPNSYAENYTDVTYIDTNLQRFVCNLCKNDDVITPALIYSIAWRESFYTSDLKKFCEDKLKAAQLKIEKINVAADGNITVEPLDKIEE